MSWSGSKQTTAVWKFILFLISFLTIFSINLMEEKPAFEIFSQRHREKNCMVLRGGRRLLLCRIVAWNISKMAQEHVQFCFQHPTDILTFENSGKSQGKPIFSQGTYYRRGSWVSLRSYWVIKSGMTGNHLFSLYLLHWTVFWLWYFINAFKRHSIKIP